MERPTQSVTPAAGTDSTPAATAPFRRLGEVAQGIVSALAEERAGRSPALRKRPWSRRSKRELLRDGRAVLMELLPQLPPGPRRDLLHKTLREMTTELMRLEARGRGRSKRPAPETEGAPC